jgi:TPR repeat protein
MGERRDPFERGPSGWLHPTVLTMIGALVVAVAGVVFVLNLVVKGPAEALARATGEPYQDGMAAYRRANYPTALAQWTVAANAGDKRAQKALGDMHRLGQGADVDLRAAEGWYAKSAGQGVPEAQFELARLLDARAGNDRTLMDQALYWFKNAALQRNVEAQSVVATFHERGRGIRVDLVEAAAWYGFAAGQGHAQAGAARARLTAELSAQQITFVEQRERELRDTLGKGR